jgi:sulfhydrogenase subunit beta (sulfur reductase)
MKEKILLKAQLPKLIEELRKNYRVLAPVKDNGFYVYKAISSADEVDLDFANTKIPPKEIFFPRSEVLFTYKRSDNGIELIEPESPAEKQIILGIRGCDAQSFLLLDKFFAYGKFDDPYFAQRREKTLLIGLACNDPRSTCFCTSVGGSPFSEAGLDITLTDLGEKYLVKSLNVKGNELLGQISWLEDANERDIFDATQLTKKALAAIKEELPIEKLNKKFGEVFDEDAFWLQFSQKCIGCGSCSFLCPTCHCFDVVDEESSTGGKRIRLWDTCQFPLFTLHGSGHNPRPTGRQRLRQRVMHKFNYYPKILSEIGCVGCGRCILACPVNQDIRVVFKAVQES